MRPLEVWLLLIFFLVVINHLAGKTLHLATLMKDKGRLFAFDKSKSKVKQIQDLAHKHGITCVTALHQDSTKLLQIPNLHGLGNTNDLHQFFTPGAFDYILLDPPCSGLGIFNFVGFYWLTNVWRTTAQTKGAHITGWCEKCLQVPAKTAQCCVYSVKAWRYSTLLVVWHP